MRSRPSRTCQTVPKRWRPARARCDPVGQVSPARVLELAVDGAVAEWDWCGCGFEWYTAKDVVEMASSGPPAFVGGKHQQGALSEWRADSGAALILAEGAVRWASRMS